MISAIVLAAGQSQRMGRPKMVLPWGESTVIGRVVSVLVEAGVDEILVVTGGARPEVEQALAGMDVRLVHNPHFLNSEMLDSLKLGVMNINPESNAILVVLGDQPQIQASIVREILEAYRKSGAALVIPSYHMRRGHPWLLDRSMWSDLQSTGSPQTLRDFLSRHQDSSEYVDVDADVVLRDLDTPADYLREKPLD